MRAHAICGPWAAGERVLVGVNEDPSCAGAGALCPAPGRSAARARGPPIHIETSQPSGSARTERDRIADALRLAERLGGEA